MQNDARIASLVCSHLIPTILSNYRYNLDGGQLEDFYGNKVAVRSFTGNGCSLLPSFMRGAGRKFDSARFEEYYNDDAQIVLIVDVRSLPSISIVELLGCDIAENELTKIPAWYGDELFSDAHAHRFNI